MDIKLHFGPCSKNILVKKLEAHVDNETRSLMILIEIKMLSFIVQQ